MAGHSCDVLTTSEGLLALLKENSPDLQTHALNELVGIVDNSWHVIADHIETIEALWEDPTFVSREVAAFLASKVYYHLEEIGESLEYALNAGDVFDVNSNDEYVQTLISQCIDDYIRIRVEGDASGDKLNPQLQQIVESMLDRCLVEGFSRQALGIALESLRLDYVQKCIEAENGSDAVLGHTFGLCRTVVQNQNFRNEVYHLLLQKYQVLLETGGNPDYRNVCRCLYYLRRPEEVGGVLLGLLDSDILMAYQTAFDLSEYEDTHFLGAIARTVIPPPKQKEEDLAGQQDDPNQAQEDPNKAAEAMEVVQEVVATKQQQDLVSILTGEFSDDVYLKILYNRSHHDFVILKHIKDSVPGAIGCLNMAVASANAIMCCGTTIDQFLRDNLNWLSKFRNFDKFLSVAFIGMIHKGHVQEGKTVLEAYLPPAEGPIAGGGALYGLGIIYSNNCPSDIRDYLFQSLKDSESNEILAHGAILGNALVNIGTQNMELFSEYRNILESGAAVPGSGAGYAIGLIMAGTMNAEALELLNNYANEDTAKKSEKVIRGCCVAMALICFGQEENADDLINQMRTNRDFHLRYGACYAIAMAYTCTANNRALRMLLDLAVSDVSDDVRRAATTAIGFVFANKPDQVPDLLRLLAKSYNPFVRYGAACAIAIACASTANKKAAKLLKLLRNDNVEYVRQAAHIATGILYMQRNDTECPETKEIREEFRTLIANKRRGDKMARMGIILGSGFLDAGGRNLCISMQTTTGQKRRKAIIGMCMFWQHWEWYPFIPFVSLSFKPTIAIALNKELNLPETAFFCDAKPSKHAYPELLKEEKFKKKVLMKTAELSISAKAKARKAEKAAKKKAEAAANGEDVEMEDADAQDKDEVMEDADAGETEAVEDKKADEPEPDSYMLQNPCRVTRSQQDFVSLPPDSRYELVNNRNISGFVMLRDKRDGEEETLVSLKKTDNAGVYGNEPDPPAPFIYTGN